MHFTFRNKRIAGILTVVPINQISFMEEMDSYSFSKEKCLALKKTMGFDKRHIVSGNVCASDLCLKGAQYLIDNDEVDSSEIIAIIYVTQTPDHFMPATSQILHGKLGLPNDALCFDVNQGCTGFIYGLLMAFMLLEHSKNRKVLLMTADTLSRCASKQDRNVWPLIGDTAAITIVENCDYDNQIHSIVKSDGKKYDSLIIPAGGFRLRASEDTRSLKEYPDGNRRADEHLTMKGSSVFIFAQKEVPVLIEELLKISNTSKDSIDYFMLHQPNKFILEKIAAKLKVPVQKMPNNIVESFGSPSSASIPLTICHNIKEEAKSQKLKICMVGFGVGLSWGGIVMEFNPFNFCDIVWF